MGGDKSMVKKLTKHNALSRGDRLFLAFNDIFLLIALLVVFYE